MARTIERSPGSRRYDRDAHTPLEGRAAVADVVKLYDEYASAKAQGRTRYAAQLEHDHRQALEAEHARRNPSVAPATPALSAQRHLDAVERMRAEGKTRIAAALEATRCSWPAIERQARTAEIEAWKQQQAAMVPPPTVPTETQPPPLKPRKHLDALAHLRATGQRRAAATLEHTHAAALAHEARQREAELAGQPEPLSVFEVVQAAPSTWGAALENKK